MTLVDCKVMRCVYCGNNGCIREIVEIDQEGCHLNCQDAELAAADACWHCGGKLRTLISPDPLGKWICTQCGDIKS